MTRSEEEYVQVVYEVSYKKLLLLILPIFYKVMDEEKVDEEGNGFIQSFILQQRQNAHRPPESRLVFHSFLTILSTGVLKMASRSKSLIMLRRKGSGFESPHETEAVVHILIVEVGNK